MSGNERKDGYKIKTMQFSGRLTEADLDDVRRLIRSKFYWLKFLAASWYGIVLFGAIIWVTIAALMGKTQANWTGLGTLWLVIAVIVAWVFYRTKKSRTNEVAVLNASRPDWILFEDSGISTNGPNGATAFQPWSNFKGWREGKRTLFLDMQSGSFILLSVAEVSPMERQSILRFLDLHIMHRGQA
jgi:hypothetical protein